MYWVHVWFTCYQIIAHDLANSSITSSFAYSYSWVCNVVCICSDGAREKMQKEYLSDPSYSFEKMNHASKACGPLVQWAIAQVQQCNEDNCRKL